MPRLHISTISEDLAILLYAFGTNVSFDIANVIFQVIVSYVEVETTIGGLPYPFLIHEVLMVQKDGLAEDDDLELPWKPLKIFTKVENDFDVPIADNVATSSSTAPLSIMIMMASELVRIHQKRTEIAKQMKQLNLENNQLFAGKLAWKTSWTIMKNLFHFPLLLITTVLEQLYIYLEHQWGYEAEREIEKIEREKIKVEVFFLKTFWFIWFSTRGEYISEKYFEWL